MKWCSVSNIFFERITFSRYFFLLLHHYTNAIHTYTMWTPSLKISDFFFSERRRKKLLWISAQLFCWHAFFLIQNFLLANISVVQTSKRCRCHPQGRVRWPIFQEVYGTNPFITSVGHCERSEGGCLCVGWGWGSVKIREQEAAPWYGPLSSDPTVLCLLTQPGRRRTCLPSLGHSGIRAQLTEEWSIN